MDNNYWSMNRKTGSLIKQDVDANMMWKVATSPAIEPVTLEELKFFARIDTTYDDSILTNFIQSARESMENLLGRALIEQTISLQMDFWPSVDIELPRPPLISIDKVVVLDEDDAETTYSASNYYIITNSTPGKIILKKDVTPPNTSDRYYGGHLIQYKAGYGDEAADIPRAIRDGILMWAAIMYEKRVIDTKNIPSDIANNLRIYKVPKI